MKRGCLSNRRGVTFIELIAVMIIMVTMVIIAMTRFQFSGAELDVAAWGLRSNLQYAQDLAMTQNDDFGFNPLTSNTYEIYEGAPGSPAKNPLTNDALNIDISPVAFIGTPSALQFDASGTPNNLVVLDIALQGPQGGTRTVRVEPNTGYVRIIGAPGGCSLIIEEGEKP